MSGNPEKIDRRTLLFLVPTLCIFSGVMLFLFLLEGRWTAGRVIFISVLVVVTLLIVLTFLNQERFWWAPRVLAFMLLSAVIASVTFVFLADIQLERKESLALVVSLLVLGVPSALFVLWGSTGGKAFPQEPDSLPRRARLIFVSIRVAKWLVLAALLITGFWLANEILR